MKKKKKEEERRRRKKKKEERRKREKEEEKMQLTLFLDMTLMIEVKICFRLRSVYSCDKRTAKRNESV